MQFFVNTEKKTWGFAGSLQGALREAGATPESNFTISCDLLDELATDGEPTFDNMVQVLKGTKNHLAALKKQEPLKVQVTPVPEGYAVAEVSKTGEEVTFQWIGAGEAKPMGRPFTLWVCADGTIKPSNFKL